MVYSRFSAFTMYNSCGQESAWKTATSHMRDRYRQGKKLKKKLVTNKVESENINCDLSTKTAILEIQSYIEAIEKNSLLYDEKKFDKRIEVIDFIEFHVIGQIEALLQSTSHPDKLISLKYRAEKVKSILEEVDVKLFQRLQENIRIKGYIGREFKNLIYEYFDFNLNYSEQHEEIGYDNLDVFINRLLPFQDMPEQTKDLEPEWYIIKKHQRELFSNLQVNFILGKKTFFLT